jgi:hypothetical protein
MVSCIITLISNNSSETTVSYSENTLHLYKQPVSKGSAIDLLRRLVTRKIPTTGRTFQIRHSMVRHEFGLPVTFTRIYITVLYVYLYSCSM